MLSIVIYKLFIKIWKKLMDLVFEVLDQRKNNKLQLYA